MRGRLLALLAFIFLAGCLAPHEKAEIVASIRPLYLIAKEFGNATYLIPENANPHLWEPRPSDIEALRKAEAYVKVGAGFEAWDKNIKPKGAVLEAASYISLNEGNPHVWTDPRVALGLARDLSKITGNKDAYERFSRCLNETVRTIKAEAEKRNITYVAYHPAFIYFSDYFGLHEAGVLTKHGEPSLRKYEEIKELMLSRGIKLIFISKNLNSALAERLAQETNTTLVRLDIMGSEADSYCEYLQNLWRSIREAYDAQQMTQ